MANATSTTPPRHHPNPRSRVPRGEDSSPWTQIVRGIELESMLHSKNTDSSVAEVVSPPLSSPPGDVALNTEEEGSLDGKKTVWDKPSDVAVEVVVPLMGVAAWPALSESTKGSPKLPPSEGSSSVSPQIQGIGMSSSSSSSQRQGKNTNTNPSSHTNHPAPTRQKSLRRGNGGSSGNPSNIATNGGFSLAPPSQGFEVESSPNNTRRPANSESLSVENPSRESGGQRGGFGPQSNSGAEPQQRNSYRRGTGGPRPSVEGSHYEGRRDQDRGNHYRNPQRNFGGRGAQMQPQRASTRPFIRGPPHANTSYVPPPPILMHPSFGTPMVYPGPEVFYYPGPHQDPFRAGPMVPPMGPIFYPFVDPVLQTKIVNQIEYYFSTDNLAGDTYLRKNMDEQGWVSVKLIAGFNKVSQLTDNPQIILAGLQGSRIVEIEGEKLRRRGDWERWIIQPPVQHIDVSSPQSVQESGQEMLAAHLQNVSLDERRVRNINENHPTRSSPGEFSSR